MGAFGTLVCMVYYTHLQATDLIVKLTDTEQSNECLVNFKLLNI